MDVTVLRPIHEGDHDYKAGDVLRVAPSRGWRLAELGMVKAPPPWKYDYQDEWKDLRRLIGARPGGILAFPTRRSRLDELKPGESLLLLRKYGGLGDILIQSMIFPMLQDQYPHVRVTYAVPTSFHPLFAGSGVSLLAYEGVFDKETSYHRGTVRPELLERFDLIEDLSIPCHVWENFFVAYGGIAEGPPILRWRNRLDMWARWFGLRVENPRTAIVLTDAERAEARTRLGANGKPTALFAPIAANRTKSYPWLTELCGQLRAAGFSVRITHNADLPGAPAPVLRNLSLRALGAVAAEADLVVSVDTALFHWGGILRRPTVGLFNVNDGATYCRYYPTATPVQLCSTPCINVRYGNGNGTCPKLAKDIPDLPGSGVGFSRCYHQSSVTQIMEAVRALGH